MTTLRLRDLPAGCFEGVIPAILGTSAADGTPNVTWLSHVHRVDDETIALSCQFFRKTRANLEVRPRGQLHIADAATMAQFRLEIAHVATQTEGAIFEAMRHRLDVIASATGMKDTFALKSVDLFRVESIAHIPIDGTSAASPRARPDPLEGLARLAEGLASSRDLAAVVDFELHTIANHLGYGSVSMHLFDEPGASLYTLASVGYSPSGVGSSIPLGVGIIGTCAQHRLPMRVADCAREIRYERAVREQMERGREAGEREIALPGLPRAGSILAVPIVLEGRLFGVLVAQAAELLAFDDRDTRVLTTAGQLIAQAMALRDDDDDDRSPAPEPHAPTNERPALRVRYYDTDDSVFFDDEYLIKGLSGRILWLLLSMHRAEGRTSLTNRELRLHPVLKLPSYKDNLETRLLMLQRRLEDKGRVVRLVREQRGRLTLVCDVPVEIERVSNS